jgi:hypothetical protein
MAFQGSPRQEQNTGKTSLGKFMLVNTDQIVSIQKFGSITSDPTAKWNEDDGDNVVPFKLGNHDFQLVIDTDDRGCALTCHIRQGDKILLSFEGQGSYVFEGSQTNDTVELKAR